MKQKHFFHSFLIADNFFHNCWNVWMSSVIAYQESSLFLNHIALNPEIIHCEWVVFQFPPLLGLLTYCAFHIGFHWQVSYLAPSFLRNSNQIFYSPYQNKYLLLRYSKIMLTLISAILNKLHSWCCTFAHKYILSTITLNPEFCTMVNLRWSCWFWVLTCSLKFS